MNQDQFIRDALEAIGFDDAPIRTRLTAEWLEDFDVMYALTEAEIDAQVRDYGKKPVANQRISFTPVQIRKLKGLVHWFQDYRRINDDPDLNDLDDEAINQALTRARIRKDEIDKSEETAKACHPGKFPSKESKWSEWRKSLVKYIECYYGVDGVPLSYLIRPNVVGDPTENIPLKELSIKCAPHEGPAYDSDNNRLYQLITPLVHDTNAVKWLPRNHETAKDGRAVFLALEAHYGGATTGAHQLAMANSYDETLHYKNECAMPFEEFLDKMEDMWTYYHLNGQSHIDSVKIDKLLKKIQHPDLVAVKAVVSSMNLQQNITYEQAVAQFKPVIAQTSEYQAAQRQRNSRQISSTYSNRRSYGGRGRGRGGRRGGRNGSRNNQDDRGRGAGRGRGSRSRNNRGYANPYIPQDEWNRMTPEQRQAHRDQNRNARDTSRNVSAVTFANPAAASTSNNSGATSNNNNQAPPNNAGTAFGGRSSMRNNRNASVCKTGPRRVSSVTAPPLAGLKYEANVPGRNELDNHADTCCLGRNFVPLYFTGQVCDVSPYSDAYEPQRDVPIAAGATAFTIKESGETVILVVNQGLYFGEQMPCSLINQNQLRHFGIKVNDNPSEHDERPLGITCDDPPLHVPFVLDSRAS
jgi:hypothetical protein